MHLKLLKKVKIVQSRVYLWVHMVVSGPIEDLSYCHKEAERVFVNFGRRKQAWFLYIIYSWIHFLGHRQINKYYLNENIWLPTAIILLFYLLKSNFFYEIVRNYGVNLILGSTWIYLASGVEMS